MILIQLVLIGMLLFIGVNFMRSRKSNRTKAVKKIILSASLPLAIIAVLFPKTLDSAASFMGVGRGADLVLYGLVIVVIFQMFNNYIKDKEENDRLVVLARNYAILEAKINNKNNTQ